MSDTSYVPSAAKRDAPAPEGPGSAAERDAFVDEVRQFLAAALAPDLREAGRNTIGVYSDIEACRVWHRRLYEKGWIAPAWPCAFGGAGWPAWRQILFERECAANDAPVLFAGGLRNVGPLLIAIGTPEQRARYLPAILDGRDLWCQGFSEPEAGSDLAALRTRATVDGDHYVVTGRKIWTTGAHIANRMFCLVRTATTVRRQDGITFLLIDMASEGISIRPIVSLSGERELNEVVLDNVRVPQANRVGAENDSWAVAKLLMRFARTSNTTSGLLRRAMRRVGTLAEDDPDKTRLSTLECALAAFEALELSARDLDGDMDDLRASMLKTLATELHQEITAFALDHAGPNAALVGPAPRASCPAASKYFATRAASIYSGTNETHRNLMAKLLLRHDGCPYIRR